MMYSANTHKYSHFTAVTTMSRMVLMMAIAIAVAIAIAISSVAITLFVQRTILVSLLSIS